MIFDFDFNMSNLRILKMCRSVKDNKTKKAGQDQIPKNVPEHNAASG